MWPGTGAAKIPSGSCHPQNIKPLNNSTRILIWNHSVGYVPFHKRSYAIHRLPIIRGLSWCKTLRVGFIMLLHSFSNDKSVSGHNWLSLKRWVTNTSLYFLTARCCSCKWGPNFPNKFHTTKGRVIIQTPLERYQPQKGVCINIDSTSNSGHVHFEMHIAQVPTEVIRIHNPPSLKKMATHPSPYSITTQHCSCEWGPQFSHQNS